MDALWTTLLLAFLSALIATILGTMVSFAMNHMKKLPRMILMTVTNIPMLNADIVTGISLMLLFIALPDGIRQCADRAYYIQSALCGAECTSEIKADE